MKIHQGTMCLAPLLPVLLLLATAILLCSVPATSAEEVEEASKQFGYGSFATCPENITAVFPDGSKTGGVCKRGAVCHSYFNPTGGDGAGFLAVSESSLAGAQKQYSIQNGWGREAISMVDVTFKDICPPTAAPTSAPTTDPDKETRLRKRLLRDDAASQPEYRHLDHQISKDPLAEPDAYRGSDFLPGMDCYVHLCLTSEANGGPRKVFKSVLDPDPGDDNDVTSAYIDINPSLKGLLKNPFMEEFVSLCECILSGGSSCDAVCGCAPDGSSRMALPGASQFCDCYCACCDMPTPKPTRRPTKPPPTASLLATLNNNNNNNSNNNPVLCNDKLQAEFQRTSWDNKTCKWLTTRTDAKRQELCTKNGSALFNCPDTCKGFCQADATSKFNAIQAFAANGANPVQAPTIPPPTIPQPTNPLPSHDVYQDVGFCYASNEAQIEATFSSPQQCLDACKYAYSFWLPSLYAEYIDGECYCQNDCACMDDVEDPGRTTYVPYGFQLPTTCCLDSIGWRFTNQEGEPKKCKWVANDPLGRCARMGDDGRKAREACRATCNSC